MAKKTYSDEKGNIYSFSDSEEINRGGEGIIYRVKSEPKSVAKIYISQNSGLALSKFNYLQTLDKQVFVTPSRLLFENGKSVGYLMEYIEPEFTPLSAFFNSAYCLKNNIDDKIKLQISENLINAVQSAHSKSVVIGDLNQLNILVNHKGALKMIDTDSYETPGEAHSGTLLEDVRDYYHNGVVSKESDYFALAVNLFYLLTYTHPFKGIHSVHRSLKDRMIHQISILGGSSDLKIPKCYRALSDNALTAQFKRIFELGERFSIQIQSVATVQNVVRIKPVSIENGLRITNFFDSENIINADFAETFGYIETDTRFVLFNTSQKGFLNRVGIISKQIADEIFIGNENVMLRKGENLFRYVNETDIHALTNFKIPQNGEIRKSGNMLFVLDDESLFTIYPDDIINSSIKVERTPVSSRSFTAHGGFFQNIGGKRRIFYNTGKNTASVTTDKYLKQIFQTQNVGMITELVSDKLVHRFFALNGLKIKFSDEIPAFSHIAYMPASQTGGFIFEPNDNLIKLYRTEDFALISEMSCSPVHEQSRLFYTPAGIIAVNDNAAFLMNNG